MVKVVEEMGGVFDKKKKKNDKDMNKLWLNRVLDLVDRLYSVLWVKVWFERLIILVWEIYN